MAIDATLLYTLPNEAAAKPVNRPVQMANGDIFIGAGKRVYQSTDNGATWTQYYTAVDGGNNISGEVFTTVIPFVHNDILYIVEYNHEGSTTNAYVKTRITEDVELTFTSKGALIGSMPFVSHVYWIGVLDSKIVVFCHADGKDRIYKSGGLERRTGGFTEILAQQTVNQFQKFFGVHFFNSKVYYGVSEGDNFQIQYKSYDGITTQYENDQPNGSASFGHHQSNTGFYYYWIYRETTETLELWENENGGGSFSKIQELSVPNFKSSQRISRSEPTIFSSIEGKEHFYTVVNYEFDNVSWVLSRNKADNSIDYQTYNGEITYFADSFIDGFGLGNEYLELEANVPDPVPPEPPAPEIGFFRIPKIQSLHFSRSLPKEQIEDGFFPDVSNHAQQKQQFSSFGYGFCYKQRVRQTDKITIQHQSEESTIITELVDEDGNIVNTYNAVEKVNLLDRTEFFAARIENNGGNTSRVYIGGFQTIPFPAEVGTTIIEILNADDASFQGTYTVAGIDVDPLINREYLIIDLVYDAAQSYVNAEAGVIVSFTPFNIYESVINFATVNEGNYFVRTYLDGFLDETGHISEPIEVKASFKDTLKITFSNFDNAYDIDYTSGIIHIIRPECIMFKRVPSVDNTLIRNTDNSLQMLRSKPRRKFEIQFVMLPPYLHEKLAMALSHDVVTINGVQFVCEEGLDEPDYIDRFGLANATAIVEQIGWFTDYNSDDIGGLEADKGLIIANDGFIKR